MSAVLHKRITYMDQPATVACDARCNKAWGQQVRPRVDSDDFDSAFVADVDLDTAPVDPGTEEGNVSKPERPQDRLNRWCVRQCERCWISPRGNPEAEPVLPTFGPPPTTVHLPTLGLDVPRFAWHRPPWTYDTSEGLRSYQPAGTAERSGEADALRHLFSPKAWRKGDKNGAVQREGLIWLAPEWPNDRRSWEWTARAEGAIRIDLAALDPERLRYTVQAEGYVAHLGPIPITALVV